MKYNIGLDIGTSSVGWAVVEANTQKIISKNIGIKNNSKKSSKKSALWGSRLFDSAETAEVRRNFRSTRRRYDRRRERIRLLQEIFNDEINKVDKLFYQKLEESKYLKDDKANKTVIISKEEKNKIKEYNNKFPTIYHLRNFLQNTTEKQDIRLVYLAIHHIIKYRGNFLYNNGDFNINNIDLKEKFSNVLNLYISLCPNINVNEDYLTIISFNDLERNIITFTKQDLKQYIKELMFKILDDKQICNEFSKLIVGNKFIVKNILSIESDNKLSISFDSNDYDEKYGEIEELTENKIEILDALKELYDIIFLKSIFKGDSETNISSLMIKKYENHKQDLKILKDLFRKDKILKNKLFRTKNNETSLYDKYISNSITNEEFKKELVKMLDKLQNVDVTNIVDRIENGQFLPRLTETSNGKYPYQLQKNELNNIIKNQGKYYPFLLDKVDNNYKLIKLLEFRIPYYVGPLVSENKSKNAWLVKNNDNKITPFNFNEVVNRELTAEKFIRRMISHCTYLLDEFALPTNSILYSKFKVLNELKQIRVNGDLLSNEIQIKIINELFMKNSGNITDLKFKKYLKTLSEFNMYNELRITGYSSEKGFANNMQSYIDFFGINGIFLDTNYNCDQADEIIEWLTIFEDKDILENKIQNKYKLSEKQIKLLLSKKYKGWGSLSKKLITTKYYKDKKDGIYKSIIDLMYETDQNFMQIINNNLYNFQKMIEEFNNKNKLTKLSYEIVDKLVTSPATKKGIFQSLKIVEEIIKYMGCEPQNIMIEMAREEAKKIRNDNKKNYLIKLYNGCKNDIQDYKKLFKELQLCNKIDSEKLFLYFIQEGRCLYSNTKLDINCLDKYEVDHILPRSIIKDNSIDNKALVLRECNQNKAADLVLPNEYRNEYNIKWWNHLKQLKLISNKKFYRLTRKYYSKEDVEGFINRQLVETRQITKHVANIIKSLHTNVKVIYLKADISHNYRQQFELFKYRNLNDYHHAHDAYLAAVLGEYKEKYLKFDVDYDKLREINNEFYINKEYDKLKYGFVINSLNPDFSNIINKITKNLVDEETGIVNFDIEEFNKRVAYNLYRNDILISKKTEIRTGALYKQTLYKKGVGNIQIKDNMPVEKYGGYLNVECSYLTLVKYGNKYKMVGIPLSIALKSKNNIAIKIDYIKSHLDLNEDDELIIVKDNIPFETKINIESQDYYIKGYSISKKGMELCNACQLKLNKNCQIKWKYALNYLFNNVDVINKNSVSEDDLKKQLIDIVNYLYSLKKQLVRFENSIDKISKTLELENYDLNQLKNICNQLFNLYHCNSVCGNFKEYGLSDRVGRISGININKGIIKFTSTTGIRTDIYEF